MPISLKPIEARILGVLIEKQLSTPEYYPLTLNALLNACNQKSNREPVMSLNQNQVEGALTQLRAERLVWQVMTQGARAPKYEHNLKEFVDFSTLEIAIICELLLRGAQTMGELRTRTARLDQSHEMPVIEHTLSKLMSHEKGPFIIKQERRPGQKESRYMHLLGTDLESEQAAIGAETEPGVSSASSGISAAERTSSGPTIENESPPRGNFPDADRVDGLEDRLDDLQLELKELKDAFFQFKAQFE